MTSAMLAALREAADGYGPGRRLPERLGSGAVPDQVLDSVPALWAQRRPRVQRQPDRGYHPYIPDPFRSRALTVLGRSPVLDFHNPAETDADVGALAHHLLYADGVALSDPIQQIFDQRYFTSGLDTREVLRYRRARLANLARFLAVADPLIEEEILVFVQAPGYPIAYDADDLRQLATVPEIIDMVARLDPAGKELAARASERLLDQPEGSMGFGPESYAMHALNGILAGMAAGSVPAGGWDLYLPQQAMEPVLGYLTGQVTVAGTHPRLLRGLLSVELPEITRQISPRDLVAIRRNEQIFADWRHELRAALRALAEETESRGVPPAGQLRLLRQELAGAAKRADAAVGRSAAIAALKSGLVGSMIGTVVGVGFGSMATAAAGGVLSSAAGVMLGWLHGLPQRPARQALARHYAIFNRR